MANTMCVCICIDVAYAYVHTLISQCILSLLPSLSLPSSLSLPPSLPLSLPPFFLPPPPSISENHYQLVAATADMSPEKLYKLSCCFSSIFFNPVSRCLTYYREVLHHSSVLEISLMWVWFTLMWVFN